MWITEDSLRDATTVDIYINLTDMKSQQIFTQFVTNSAVVDI